MIVDDTALIFEKSRHGRQTHLLPEPDGAPVEKLIPKKHLRKTPPNFPEVAELEVVRHYTRLSQKAFSIDTNFYPLGSCTMKYNPKINEKIASMPGFARLHPHQPDSEVQGALQLMHDLQGYLAEISGMDAVTLQPAAGAQGELTGILLIKAYHVERGQTGRIEVLIPDSAHGTNPATCTLAGFKAVSVKSNARGGVDLDDLKKKLSDKTAALMITNPSTLGLFEEQIVTIAKLMHDAGAQVYMDGANMNAIQGITRPGDFGIDVMHFNLHKTFSTPHGGGGPGSGPVACKKHLEPYLPIPRVVKVGEGYALGYARPKSIGRVKAFFGNFGMHVRCYAYIRTHGPEGLRRNAENAVLNANYLMSLVSGRFKIAFDRPCMHEFVIDGSPLRKLGIHTLDVAKRLLDYGFHPPTIYFPLIVKDCLMIEPTESENRETLDQFAAALIKILDEAKTNPDLVHHAPHTMPVGRLDELKAAREPIVRYKPVKAS
ncbi:MAG TPA: aminomethyl-transferring glycine dehydrogenase subunit GcvPB [Planctomycetota bacterium]|nr:aminomethyl-transferring glycine dehydrogenase subunit GcvPB [Planctomycetota bacterium]